MQWIVLWGKDEWTGNDGGAGGPWCGFGGEDDATVGETAGLDSADEWAGSGELDARADRKSVV